jgi:hypothetical protein
MMFREETPEEKKWLNTFCTRNAMLLKWHEKAYYRQTQPFIILLNTVCFDKMIILRYFNMEVLKNKVKKENIIFLT